MMVILTVAPTTTTTTVVGPVHVSFVYNPWARTTLTKDTFGSKIIFIFYY